MIYRKKRGVVYRASALVYMVRIPDSHSGGPGSIPGCGIFLSFLFLLINLPLYSYWMAEVRSPLAYIQSFAVNIFGCIINLKVLFRKPSHSSTNNFFITLLSYKMLSNQTFVDPHIASRIKQL